MPSPPVAAPETIAAPEAIAADEAIAAGETSALAALLVHSDLIALAFAHGETLIFANASFRRLFGATDCAAGQSLASLVVPAHRSRIATLLEAGCQTPAACTVAAREDGGAVEVELRASLLTGAGSGLRGITAQDVTDRSRAAARLSLLAFSDPLTGLANRALFADRLREAVLDASRDNTQFAVLMIDLDEFKPVNDRLGHAAGDVTLQHVARRLQASLRATETVARMGGDEFAVLLRGIRKQEDAVFVADRLLAEIRHPILAGDHTVTVNASIGIALFPDHGGTVEHLLVAADTALYAAKRAGGECHAWPEDHPHASTIPRTVVWSSAYELGVPRMDQDHIRLCDLLNVLAEALLNGRDPNPAFRDFVRAASWHFAHEERLMAETRYANAATHREQHQRLLVEVAGLVLDGEDISPSLVLRYLQEWLFRHIDGPDREFAAGLHPSHHAAEVAMRGAANEGGRAAPNS